MASFRKRGDYWEYRIVYKDPSNGKKREISRSKDENGKFKTKKRAQLAAAETEKQISMGIYGDFRQEILFKDYAAYWFEQYSLNKKISTIKTRKIEYKILVSYFGYMEMRKITPVFYQQFLNKLKPKYADNTIAGIHSSAKMIFKRAYQDNVIKHNPTLYAELPKTTKTVEEIENSNAEKKHMEADDLKLFLQTVKEKGIQNDYVIFTTLAATGLRVGELCALTWDRVDFEEKYIHITKTVYNPTYNMNKTQLVPPKNKSSIRFVDIDDNLIKILKDHKAKQNVHKMSLRKAYQDQGFVFAKEFGHAEVVKKIEIRMKRLMKLAKLDESCTPHTLRHTHATMLREQGIDLEFIQRRLGHVKGSGITGSTYLHQTEKLKKEASDKINSLTESFII